MTEKKSLSSDVSSIFRYVARDEFRTKPFVVLGGETLTYGSLSELTERTARLFRQVGIDIGDRIVICSEHEIEVIVLYLAAMRCGVTPALIDPTCSLPEARNLVRAAEAKALFADERLLKGTSIKEDLLTGGEVFVMAPGLLSV